MRDSFLDVLLFFPYTTATNWPSWPHSGEAGPGSAGRLICLQMSYLYVLKSIGHNRIYIGVTEDVGQRLREHNEGKTKSTKPYTPYVLVYSEYFQIKSQALKRERQIKNSGKLRKELKDGTYHGPIV